MSVEFRTWNYPQELNRRERMRIWNERGARWRELRMSYVIVLHRSRMLATSSLVRPA